MAWDPDREQAQPNKVMASLDEGRERQSLGYVRFIDFFTR
jgi:hypothetical protein